MAGNGDPNPYQSPTEDGVAATSARLRLPMGIAVHPSGDIYFSDFHDARICKVDAAGMISTFVDDLRNPTWLQFDPAENLYAAELFDNHIVRIVPSGNGLTSPPRRRCRPGHAAIAQRARPRHVGQRVHRRRQ